MTFAAGTKLGPHEIVAGIGHGGRGEVYRALDTRLGRPVAIKVIANRWRDRPDLRARFHVEPSPPLAGPLPRCREADGGTLIYRVIQPQGQWNLWALTMADRQRRALAPSPFNQMDARFSPDGRWLAYVSNETGRNELYVRSVEDGGRSPISNAGAQMAAWARDGHRLYYRDQADGMWAADIAGTPRFKASQARLLFRVSGLSFSFDVTADGMRLVAIRLEPRTWATQIDLVLNPLSAAGDGSRLGPTTP